MTHVSAQPVAHADAGRHFSLRGSMVALVLMCVLPAVVGSAILMASLFQLKQAHMEQQAALVARTVLADLDSELSAVESALQVLTTSRELHNGDLPAFYQRATDALGHDIVINYLLTNPQGQQVLNTLVPWGSPLPEHGTPGQLWGVFAQRKAVLTHLFKGPVTGEPVIAMGVPVEEAGQVIYSLNVGLSPARVSQIVSRNAINADWTVAVLDQSGTIVGRNSQSERYLGEPTVPALLQAVTQRGTGTFETVTKEGTPVFTSFVTSSRWGWRVVAGAPTAIVQHDMNRYLGWLLGSMGVALLVGLVLAHQLAVRVLSSVRGLNDAALALGRGEAVTLPRVQLREAEAVGQAMLQASDMVQRVRFMARHDPLTELPNRLLLAEAATHQLALAARQQRQLAILALDLDGFKGVNDTLGHARGDEVLKTTAQRILQTIRAADMVARVGGDEFLIMLTDATPEAAMETAQRLVAVLSVPFAGVAVPVSASVGVAMFPHHGADLQALSIRADAALYEAKRQGKGRATLSPEPSEKAKARA